MKMGTYIKKLREKIGLSQEELGKRLVPPVNRAAINKWEKGTVENLKRTHIQQLADILGTTPSLLMSWEDDDAKVLQLLNLLPPEARQEVINFAEAKLTQK